MIEREDRDRPLESSERLWWQAGVIYQVYPRSFQDTDGDGVGDLRGVIERLNYLERHARHRRDLALTVLPIADA